MTESVLRKTSGIDWRPETRQIRASGARYSSSRGAETGNGPSQFRDHASVAVPRLRDGSGISTRRFQRRASVALPRLRGPLPCRTPNDRTPPEVTPLGPITVGPLALRWRALVLRILEHLTGRSPSPARCFRLPSADSFRSSGVGWLRRYTAGPTWSGSSAGSGSASRRAIPTPTSVRCWRGWTHHCSFPRPIRWPGGSESDRRDRFA